MTSVEETAADVPASAHRVAELLGVVATFRRKVDSAVAVHEFLSAGLPNRALLKAIESVDIPPNLLLPVFAISFRTLMRLKHQPSKPLASEQSSRVWQFGEVVAKAEDVLGTKERAVEWMLQPAMALENHTPIDLLTTSVGAKLVEDALDRMRYGVYQ